MRHLAGRVLRLTLIASAMSLIAAAQQGFAWRDLGNGRMELRDNGNPALVYNYGLQHRAGAPEDRRRCCYIFPLYTPAGVSMLDDFPEDHWHHRGIFWAWPVVETGGQTFDHWMKMTARNQPQGSPVVHADKKQARLETRSMWQADGKDIVRERVRVTVLPSTDSARELEVEVTLEAVESPVTLRGSAEKGKSYGGFSARFAPREKTVLRADSTVLTRDEDLNPRRWAELEAIYGGKKAALRITPVAGNLGVPYQWCLRAYGFVGASFPGRTDAADGYTLQPGKPLTLSFRVRASDVQ
ncbi:MAG TPA: DUF6807 family protein [Bryobacteraceae bacterium]|nr:DUF6807 family protein [Bryobacteraceae bacterium]